MDEFAKEVVNTKGFKYPNTFTRAVEIVASTGVDVHECVQLGLSAFKYFPRITYWDASRNAKASWNFKEYVELVCPKNTPSLEARAASLTGDVLAFFEGKGLCYGSKLKKYTGVHLPWMVTCLKRLPVNLPMDQLVLLLGFLSSIALIQNGDIRGFWGLERCHDPALHQPVSTAAASGA